MYRFVKIILLIFVGSLILESRKCSGRENEDHTKWWKTTLVYQLSTRFFEDSDGDGIGDLLGMTYRLDYISSLGVETICLMPIYPSPLIDSGYDVSDHEDVHPMYGNLSDFDRLVDEAHAREMKIIMDVVLDYTSDEHKWFKASIEKKEPYADYYVWENGTITADGDVAPPNNWTSVWEDSKNSAWTYNNDRGEWYLHKFHESEPDLDLDNPYVHYELMRILEFWLDRGVDGFRIMGIPFMFENPRLAETENLLFLLHIRTFVDEWTLLNNSTDKFLITGSYDTEESLSPYYDIGVLPLNHCFFKDTVIVGTNARDLKTEITEWLEAVPANASTNWMLSNGDSRRIASRAGSDRVDALHMLTMLLPGQAFTYYGDEMGMPSTPASSNVSTSSDSHSETPKSESHIDFEEEQGMDDAQSHLHVYMQLAELRKNAVFVQGDWELRTANDDNVLILRRTLPDHPIYVVVMNLAENAQRINMADSYEDLSENLRVVVVSGANKTDRTFVPRDRFFLQPNAGVVLKSDEANEWQDVHLENGSGQVYEERWNGTEEINEPEETNEMENTTILIDGPREKAVTRIYDIPGGNINFTNEASSDTANSSPEDNAIESVPHIVAASCALLANPLALISVLMGNMIFAGIW